jgi:ectoine hydroxylase-related dioxygenase (phytanoyl-CoA dioxygenase family)
VEEQRSLKKADLRANRTEIFVPLEDDLPDPRAESVVTAVVAEYVGEPFTLDYVSVLNARAGIAGTQDLHPDVPFFPRTSLSVHTVLDDITEAMGPTLFCPCTHSVTQWEEMPSGTSAAEAIALASALRNGIRATGSASERRCLGSAYVPHRLSAGLVTIYDGALLHAGLANTANIDRVVLNVNFASPPGYEHVRNYTAPDPERVQIETARWRARSANSAGER